MKMYAGKKIKFRRLLLIPLLFIQLQSWSQSPMQYVYAMNLAGEIYKVNPINCSSSLIFTAAASGPYFDLAIDPANPNVFYATAQANQLFKFDLSTAQTTLLNNQFMTVFPGNHMLNGLVCDGNGTLYAADGFTSNIFGYDIANNTWNFIGTPGGYTSDGDLVYYNGLLYMTTYNDEIVTISLSPFGVQNVAMTTPANIYGLAIASTATLCDTGTTFMAAASGSDLYTVDPATGTSTLYCTNVTLNTTMIAGLASLQEGANPPMGALLAYASALNICPGASTTLNLLGADSCIWQPGNLTGNSVIVQPAVTTTYTVIGFDTSGCSDTTQLTIVINPVITLSTASQMTSCFSSSDGSANATATGGTAPYSYNWSPVGGNAAAANNLFSGTYTITVTDNYGCIQTQTVTVNQPPPVAADAGISVTILQGQTTALNGSGGVTYNWSPAAGLSCAGCQNPNASPTVTTTYMLAVTDANGCTTFDSVTVFVDADCGDIFLPNAFSPNGDEQNDVLYVRGNCIKYLDFQVYNRWGEKVFETMDPAIGWDGMWRGVACENGVFTYMLQVTFLNGTQIEKRGNVSIVK
jgi:gliding motility-associated-like protein